MGYIYDSCDLFHVTKTIRAIKTRVEKLSYRWQKDKPTTHNAFHLKILLIRTICSYIYMCATYFIYISTNVL